MLKQPTGWVLLSNVSRAVDDHLTAQMTLIQRIEMCLSSGQVGVEAYAKMLMEENGYPEIKSVLCECRRVRDYDGFEASYF